VLWKVVERVSSSLDFLLKNKTVRKLTTEHSESLQIRETVTTESVGTLMFVLERNEKGTEMKTQARACHSAPRNRERP
jgi:hypothetical protein